ncbi:RsiV family protein [Mycobacterium sp. DL440]|uniref:RsiV family protein n=1 Tax=Mycobacterium sp. DL440 TaxID=2675523 RepID=UPI0014248D2E|nr:RsiV family protein [Mycobacterium sp. DL440]
MSESTVIRRLASVLAVTSVISTATACNPSGPGGPGTSADPVPSTTTSASGTANAAPFKGFIEPVKGTEGTVTYQVDLPQLRGGNTAVRDRFNTGMRAALGDCLKPSEGNAPVTIAPAVLGEDDRSEVSHIGTGAVAGVLLVNIFVDHAAHPFNAVSTTVINARTAEPIMITDLFTDQTAGLSALVDGIKAEIAGDEKLANQAAPEPVADQLANWVPDDDGLVIYLPVAHVLGDYYPVTVDWDAIAGVLAPGMRETLTM